MIARENKRVKYIKALKNKREELKSLALKSDDFEAQQLAQQKLQKLPVNSSASRHVRRCEQCGRPKGVYRKFALCRICLRNQLMRGNVPGARKSSW